LNALQPELVAAPDAFDQLVKRLNNIQDPGEFVMADPDAVKAARAEKPARIDFGADAEQKVKGYLNRLLHGDLIKSRLVERVLYRGTPKQFSVWSSTDVDLVGSLQLEYNGSTPPIPAHIEVKSIVSKNWSVDGISPKELKFLGDAIAKRHIAWLALAWYSRHNECPDCEYAWIQHPITKCVQCGNASVKSKFSLDTLHVIRFREWFGILEKLQERTKTDPRFKGKSIRRQTDWDLISHCQIDKVNSHWQLSPQHWLISFLPQNSIMEYQFPI